MNYTEISKILAAIRMTASDNKISSVKFIEKTAISPLKDSLLKKIKVIQLKGKNQEELLSNISDLVLTPFTIIDIIGFGLAVLASNPLSAELLNDESIHEKNITLSEPKTFIHGRLPNKIAVITGAAQGFGEGIAEELFTEGANVIIADINESKGIEISNELNKKNSSNRSLFIKTDVTKPESVQNLITKTVLAFGGIDLFISNAGILRAGSLDETNFETFDSVTKVNYYGYFNCVKYASEIMKFQNQIKTDYFTDIIQINSKSGLKGSNKNFSYAGGKFGGIGLTQSFALELMPYRIKVNSICPGNLFEGHLWSDPEQGLFVQYLRAGKVPGAKTIEDVKKYYEAQIPAGRGCRITDVMKAIYYIIDQEYETGQAIPVTGGQIMLH